MLCACCDHQFCATVPGAHTAGCMVCRSNSDTPQHAGTRLSTGDHYYGVLMYGHQNNPVEKVFDSAGRMCAAWRGVGSGPLAACGPDRRGARARTGGPFATAMPGAPVWGRPGLSSPVAGRGARRKPPLLRRRIGPAVWVTAEENRLSGHLHFPFSAVAKFHFPFSAAALTQFSLFRRRIIIRR